MDFCKQYVFFLLNYIEICLKINKKFNKNTYYCIYYLLYIFLVSMVWLVYSIFCLLKNMK